MQTSPTAPRAWSLLPLLATLAVTLGACGGSSSAPGTPEASAGEATGQLAAEFSTDFSKGSVPIEEFTSGGPPKDGIPAIDAPRFVSVEQAGSFLEPKEPVAVVSVDGQTHAYPLQILVWHEIGDRPITVTYCPLCNSTVAFDREIDGRVLDFGTTGRLRNSDLVMYDRETESWWQQLTAEAVVGELTGTKLGVVASQILSWEQVERTAPDAQVLSRDTGFERDYGANPYVGYDDPGSQPFLLDGKADDRLQPKERVSSVRTGERSAVVYPFSRLSSAAPLNDEIGGRSVVVMFDPEVRSALDASTIAAGRESGAAAVFDRRLDGRLLSFGPGPEPGQSRDRQTGSVWESSGEAVDGRLSGKRLEQIPSDDQFWFAVAAFLDDVDIRGEAGR